MAAAKKTKTDAKSLPGQVEPSAESRLFKHYFDEAAARALGAQLRRGYPKLDLNGFVRDASRDLAPLEMMARVTQFSDAMRKHLPADIPKALSAIVQGLPPPITGTDGVTDGFLQWPVGQFILAHCVEHPDEAMPAMYQLTKRFSSEFAVRPFIERYPQRTLKQLLDWTNDENPHVRRWCSEGSRPRLPWGKRLNALVADPSPILPILEQLKDDPELYVRKSVANNLNDIAKDHPDVVLQVCERWSRGGSAERKWVIKHALRSLIKAGDARALKLVGFGPVPRFESKLSVAPGKVSIGGAVTLQLTLRNPSNQTHELIVDFRVHYTNAKGEAKKPKVFKWTTLSVDGRSSTVLTKTLKLEHATIRQLHPGLHAGLSHQKLDHFDHIGMRSAKGIVRQDRA